jgi:hypothetical protein
LVLASAAAKTDRSIRARRAYTEALNDACSDDCARRLAVDFRKNYKPLIAELDRNVPDRDSLNEMFEAVRSIAFMTWNPEHTRALTAIYEALEKRGWAVPAQTSNLYDQLIDEREFDRGRSLLARHPDAAAQPLPEIGVPNPIPESAPKAYEVSADGKKARLLPMKLDGGPSVIVVVSCHFSDDAISAIEKEPILRDVFEKHSLLIAPQDQLRAAPDMASWNARHPGLKAFVVYKESEWPRIKSWDMPHFYFMNRGRVVYDFSGWWGKDEPKDLWKGLRLVGLVEK